jgi:hypothetical protein
MSAERYVQLIQEQGVDFRMTADDEQEISSVGNYLGTAGIDALIAAARVNYLSPTMSLSGRIDQAVPRPDTGASVQVFIRLSIRNEGPPSGAYKYVLHISSSDRSIDFKVTPKALDRTFMLRQDGGPGEFVLEPQDDLARKTGQAMAQGQVVSGWLRFPLPFQSPEFTPDVLRRPGIRYVVSFADSAGGIYTAAYDVR